jgi:hypothetical protein
MRKFTIAPIAAGLALGLAGAAIAAAPAGVSPARPGELILYQQPNFNADNVVVEKDRTTITTDWNIRSIAIHEGESWQVCAKPRYQQPCLTLTRSVPDASTIGIMGQIGSVRRTPAGH